MIFGIHAVERNKYSPSLELAFKIAQVFVVAIEDIFLYETDLESGNLSQDGVTIRVDLRRSVRRKHG